MPVAIVLDTEALAHIVRSAGVTVKIDYNDIRICDMEPCHGSWKKCDSSFDSGHDRNKKSDASRPPLPRFAFLRECEAENRYHCDCHERRNGLWIGKQRERIERAREGRRKYVRSWKIERDALESRTSRGVFDGRNATG